MVSLQIISIDNLDRTLEVYINAKRYLFWFHGEVPTPTVRKIMRYSAGRAIQYLRQASYKVELVDRRELIHNGNKETETTEHQATQDQMEQKATNTTSEINF